MSNWHYPASARQFRPWKNGGGETAEIAVSPAGAGFDDFDWRISTAIVAQSGPFSGFPGVDRVLTLDLHATQIQGFFDIPVDNLYAAPIFSLDIMHHFKGRMDDLMIVSPDVGGVARAREIAARIDAPMAIVDKRREKAGEIAEMTVIGDVAGKTCIIVDDICDTAGTLVKAAQLLADHGATEVHAYITHGVLSGPAVERIEKSVMKSLVVTDSISQPEPVKNARNIRIVPTAPLFAQAIMSIWNGTSVSSLFELETLLPIYEGMYSAG